MNEPQNEFTSRIVTAIRQRERFLIATHIRPDGDAAGSLLALTFMLRKLGKEAVAFSRDPLPPNLEFLPGAEEIRHEWPDPSRFDAAILVDCGDLHRVGAPFDEAVREIPLLINIDHHISNAPFGDLYWVDPSAGSTCEMLYHLARGLGVALDQDIASQLYTGVLTDTGCFRFANTNQQVLEIAASLVAAGAEPHTVAERIYDSAPAQQLYLLGRVLSTVAFYADNRLATLEVTQKMLEETGTTAADTDGMINHLRSVKSVELAMLFREEKDGLVNVSMRSKGAVDVAALARRFKGGGHRNAAAFKISGSMEAVRRRYTEEALNHLGSQKRAL
jgi:phosphoesterase RecJ-like protein